MSCPLDCPYLREARGREKPRKIDPESVPNRDVRVTDQFLGEQNALVAAMMRGLATSGLGLPGASDLDVREALDSLTQTYRTLESGLYYESKPANLLAARIHELMQKGIEEYRKEAAEHSGITTVRDADILGVLVFFQRVGLHLDNGRKRGRAFLEFLQQHSHGNEMEPGAPPGSSLLLP